MCALCTYINNFDGIYCNKKLSYLTSEAWGTGASSQKGDQKIRRAGLYEAEYSRRIFHMFHLFTYTPYENNTCVG